MAAQLHTVKLLLVMACVTDGYWLVVCNDRRVQIQYLKSTRLLVMIFFSLRIACVCSCLYWARQLCDRNHDDRVDVHD